MFKMLERNKVIFSTTPSTNKFRSNAPFNYEGTPECRRGSTIHTTTTILLVRPNPTENHGGKLGSNWIAFRRSVNVFPCWCKQSVSSNSLTSLHLSAHPGKSGCVTVLCAEKWKQWVLEMSLLDMMLKYMPS